MYLVILVTLIVLKLYLSNFLHSEIMTHRLRNPLIIQERQVCMVFSRSCRWKSVEMVDINDKTVNLLCKVWPFAHRLCNSKACPGGGIFDVWNVMVAFKQLKVISTSM